jgi:hypothetical protein
MVEKVGGVFTQIREDRERARIEKLVDPSISNMFELMTRIKKEKLQVDATDDEGNMIRVAQVKYNHTFSPPTISPYTSSGVKITVRQKLPEDRVGGEKYLSTIFGRDERQDITVCTCVVTPDEELEFRRVGDLRVDYLRKKTGFNEGVVDGNDNEFGIPTGEWHIDGVPYDGALTRAYQLLLRETYQVGEVQPLGQPGIKSFLTG